MFEFIDKINADHGIEVKRAISQTDPVDVSNEENPFAFWLSDQFPKDDIEILNHVYQLLPIVYRCINTRANNLASLPLRIIQTDSQGNEIDISDDPDFKVLIQKPNPFYTNYDFWRESSMHLDSQGELFWNFDLSPRDEILSIYWDWRSEEVKVNGHPSTLYDSFERTVNGRTTIHLPEQVMFIKYADPTNILRGLSPLRVSKDNVILSVNERSFLKNFFKQGLRVGGLLTTDKNLDEKQKNRLKSEIRAHHSGVDNMHKFMVLWNSMTYEAMEGMNLREAEIVALSEMNREDIAIVYGTPFEVLGFGKKTDENFKAAMTLFWEQTMIPYSKTFSACIDAFLLPRLSNKPRIKSRFDLGGVSALKHDIMNKAKIFDMAIKNGSASRNEYRQSVLNEFGKFDPLPGDEFETPQISQGNDVAVQEIDSNDDIKAIVKQFTEEERTAIWHEKIAIIERSESAIQSALVGYFDRQQREVLQRFDDQFKDLALIEEKQIETVIEVVGAIFDFDLWVNELKELGEPLLVQIVSDAALEWIDGDDFDTTHPSVRFALGERVRLFSELPNTTTKIKLQNAIREGFSANESIEQIKDRIKKIFVEASEARAQLIARTEAVGAANFGTQQGLLQGGWLFKMWITSRDNRVRESHKIDGQVKPIDAFFTLNDGRTMEFPHDFNERCIIIGVRNSGDRVFTMVTRKGQKTLIEIKAA